MKKLLTVLLVLFYLSITLGIAEADNYGTYLGSFNGVPCYSNGYVDYNSGSTQTYNNINVGLKYQCVHFANLYYAMIYNMNINNQPHNNGKDYFPTASLRGLTSFPNGSSTKPAVGDILCSNSGQYGHVAIIRSVGSNYIEIIQQNWFNNVNDVTKRLDMTFSNGTYTVANFSTSYSTAGWLRKTVVSGYGSISNGLSVSPNPIVMTQSFTLTATLKETGGAMIKFDTIVCAVLFNGIFKFDLQRKVNVTLQANGTYVYSSTSTQFGSGTTPAMHTFLLRGYKLGFGWFDFSTTGAGVNPRNFQVTPLTGIDTTNVLVLSQFNLLQNYPNPFNPSTTIKFTLPLSSLVNLTVYDALGRNVMTVINETLKAGNHEYSLNASNFPSGVYYYRLNTADFSDVKCMILLK